MKDGIIQLRSANSNDIAVIYTFIHKKSEFDRSIGAYSGNIQTSEAKIRQTIFSTHPFAYVLLAETCQDVVGFALYGFRYSSFLGQPSIWLDDLYVKENMRSKGAGTLLMRQLQQIAQENNCTHLAWTADARNTRGVKFYYRLGAKIVEQKGDYRCFFTWTLQPN
jgi:GNAT superfamily N-acetyltransferase